MIRTKELVISLCLIFATSLAFAQTNDVPEKQSVPIQNQVQNSVEPSSDVASAAQETVAPNTTTDPSIPSEPTATESIEKSVAITQDGMVSLDFRDADIRNVLKILAYRSGTNIVASPSVTGTVNIQLNNVPWEEALAIIVQTYGFAYDKRGNIINVTTVDDLKKRREDSLLLADQEPLETKTFPLKFSKAAEAVGPIARMKSERGSVDIDERTNTLIVTDMQTKLKLMEQVVTQLDKTTPQVMIEGKVVKTVINDHDVLGIDWDVVASASGAARPTTYPFRPITPGANSFTPGNFPAPASTEFNYGTLSFSAAQAVFTMLNSRSDTEVLSNPKIVTLDNKTANIKVGKQYPIPTYTYSEEQNKLQVSGWEYKDIGIIFNVTPHVNSAKFVTMDVEPTISDIDSERDFEGTSLPILTNESAKTSVLVKSGDTLVIAGLIKKNLIDTKKKVPFLGDIPLIGRAFRNTDKTEDKTDLIIFITPHIITPEVNAVEE